MGLVAHRYKWSDMGPLYMGLPGVIWDPTCLGLFHPIYNDQRGPPCMKILKQ